jgi:hypothetical protein
MKDAVATMGAVLPDDAAGRDAVHVAVFSAYSAERVFPGQEVAIIRHEGRDALVTPNSSHPVAIVDPFLQEPAQAGERFWAYLYPRTITALSHCWSHPAFEATGEVYAAPASRLASEKWLKDFCNTTCCPGYDVVMAAAERVADGHDGSNFSRDHLHFNSDAHGEIPPEFWDHVAVVLGRQIMGPRARYFSCGC